MRLHRPGAAARTAAAPLCILLALWGATSPARAQDEPRSRPAAPAQARGYSWVLDTNKVFDEGAVEKARARLADLERSTGLAGFVETVDGVNDEPIAAAAARRAGTWGGTGVYVLIDRRDRRLEVLPTGPVLKAMDRPRVLAIRDAFLDAFKKQAYDDGLTAGVEAIRSNLADLRREGKLPATVGGPPLVQRNQVRLTLEGARRILAGAEARAAEMKLKVNIAVVDDGGHLLAFIRMDGARPASGYTAITKATTAATFRQETGPLPKGAASPDPLLNLSLQNAAAASGGKITTLFGGVPVLVDGQVIGGVGVGGGTGEQDAQVARAGIEAFLSALGVGAQQPGQPGQGGNQRPQAPGGREGADASRPGAFFSVGLAKAEPVPHGQDRAPNEPRTPAEAAKKMTVPEGFSVEVVAAEPDLVNPVAMTFDERGRVWVTESLEYPRRIAGPGRDRVKVLEDTDGDGRADKFTVFADGLNIPSGVAVGHGGVWVANAPDILFLQDTDGDGKADRREVVVTGFGRADTHELPNTLAWGPDGWLYGWNGVFNPSRVAHRGKTYEFTCAVFRVHPRTRDFELFCEGTSNPWGLAWDNEGSAFASACVIDHLWHLTETGYYHRQGGPYPPFTWKIGSIADHRHQKAAYCGIHFYDSDTYPPAYRETLFMGNIHGNCVNADRLRRNGSTYAATAAPDFLTANDAWFMPVSQKTGPDGCLYVLDWYDRYHCYQDANRDPAGIDRLKGRLYRVRYKDAPRRTGFDLSKKTDAELVGLLGSPNGYDRDTARRLLTERPALSSGSALRKLALDTSAGRRTRMNAVWVLVGRGGTDAELLLALMRDPDPGFRAWGVRAAGNARHVAAAVSDRVAALARDPIADVRLQVAVAARKVEGLDPVAVLAEVASAPGDDPLIPHVVWQNLLPSLAHPELASAFLGRLDAGRLKESPGLVALMPHLLGRLLSLPRPGSVQVQRPVALLIEAGTPASLDAARECLGRVAAMVQSGELSGPKADALRRLFEPVLTPLLESGSAPPLRLPAALLAASWKDTRGYAAAREAMNARGVPDETRLAALNALIAAGDRGAVDSVAAILAEPGRASAAFRGQALSALGGLGDDRVAEVVLAAYPRLEPGLRPRAVELLTQRAGWARALLAAVGRGVVSPDAINVNQVRKMTAGKDPELARLVKERWGIVREGRDPRREQVIRDVRDLLRKTPGDPSSGAQVFQKLCGQCHKIYGEGQDVGPELTANGRGSFDQLLSNVFDPSLVIGAAYQGTTVATTDGRVLTGLLVERSAARVVLKMQGGKVETVPADLVDEVKVSPTSLMPEDLEKQLHPQEMADLFAYLTLDKPPSDPSARPIPGAAEIPRGPKSH